MHFFFCICVVFAEIVAFEEIRAIVFIKENFVNKKKIGAKRKNSEKCTNIRRTTSYHKILIEIKFDFIASTGEIIYRWFVWKHQLDFFFCWKFSTLWKKILRNSFNISIFSSIRISNLLIATYLIKVFNNSFYRCSNLCVYVDIQFCSIMCALLADYWFILANTYCVHLSNCLSIIACCPLPFTYAMQLSLIAHLRYLPIIAHLRYLPTSNAIFERTFMLLIAILVFFFFKPLSKSLRAIDQPSFSYCIVVISLLSQWIFFTPCSWTFFFQCSISFHSFLLVSCDISFFLSFLLHFIISSNFSKVSLLFCVFHYI